MKKFVAVILTLLLCLSCVNADKEPIGYRIEINAAARILRLYNDGKLIKEYPIAVGKPSTKSPLGNFAIRNKAVDPYWHNHGNIVPPGPKNPLGVRWMGISAPRGTYGIHGNSTPSSIGTFASGGCIRMYNSDVVELYSIVSIGASVQLKYENIEYKLDQYTNSPVLIVYPDVYKQRKSGELIKKIGEADKNITEEQKTKALKLSQTVTSNPAAVCQGTGVFLNNQFVTNAALVEENVLYLDCKASSKLLGLDQERIAALSIPLLQKNGRDYMNLTKAVELLGGELKLDEKTGNAYLDMSLVKLNGKYLYSYKGGFDKIYEADLTAFSTATLCSKGQQETNDLRELCKQSGWTIKVDSLNKVIDIQVPLKLKLQDGCLETTAYKGRYYINADQTSGIPGLQVDSLKAYEYLGQKYYDVYEIMATHEYQQDSFFTTIEVLKPLNSQV